MKFKIIVIVIFCLLKRTYAQEKVISYPKVGDHIEDHNFTDLLNYQEKELSISDYKGKWLVLDFWNRYCAGCIASLPHMDELSKKVAEKVKIVSVAMYDATKSNDGKIKDLVFLKALIARKTRQYDLTFTIAFDSLARKKYAIEGTPAIFVINPSGVIVAKTINLDESSLDLLINGNSISGLMGKSYSENEKRPDSDYNWNLPLLTNGLRGNGGGLDTSFIGRSLLTRYNSAMPESICVGWTKYNINAGLQKSGSAIALGVDLAALFKIAYTATDTWSVEDSLYQLIAPKVIFEMKDSLAFKSGYPKNSRNAYGYSITIPSIHSSPERLRMIMLQDLHRYFGVQSSMENRSVPVYKLVIVDSKKINRLKTRGLKFYKSKISGVDPKYIYLNFKDSSIGVKASDEKMGYAFYNYSFKKFITTGPLHHALFVKESINTPPLLDCTGLDFNVDIEYEGDPDDLNESLKMLNNFGLNIVKSTAIMKCIVVRDIDFTGTK